MATALSAQPVFARIPNEEKRNYDRFFEYTSPAKIGGYGRGWKLTYLVELADRVCAVNQKANPILQEGSPQNAVIPGRQWDLNHLSDVKKRVGKAIEYKRAYYDNSIWGMITKFFLKVFGLWNGGDTAAIIKAEDFLIKHDSRLPLMRLARENYTPCSFFPFTDAAWVRANLDTHLFYNYNPIRTIPAAHQVRYDALDPRNPVVFIRG